MGQVLLGTLHHTLKALMQALCYKANRGSVSPAVPRLAIDLKISVQVLTLQSNELLP